MSPTPMTFKEWVRLGRSVCSWSSRDQWRRPIGHGVGRFRFTHGLGRPSTQGPPDRGRDTDHERERSLEDRQGKERGHRQRYQCGMPQGSATHAHHGLRDDDQDRGGDRGEHGGDDGRVARAHVEGRQAEQSQHPRQHEQDSSDQPTAHTVQQPSDVDRQLLGLWPREQRAERQRVEESLLPDPPLLVDQGVLHHRDLPSRAAEGLQGDREPGTGRLPQRDQPSARPARGRAASPGDVTGTSFHTDLARRNPSTCGREVRLERRRAR